MGDAIMASPPSDARADPDERRRGRTPPSGDVVPMTSPTDRSDATVRDQALRDPAPKPTRTSTTRRQVAQVQDGFVQTRTDVLAVEEPLEIRLYPPDDAPFIQVSVTMRTPGHDFELAAGFLYTEGILRRSEQVQTISYCTDARIDREQQYNIVNVAVRPGTSFDADRLRRNFYATSSCGVCGKASIDAIHVQGIAEIPEAGPVVKSDVLYRLGDLLRRSQTIFEATGGLHAAGLFDEAGRLLAIREDVGRHNAVDKLIGHALLTGALPLHHQIMMISGRAGFEIVQKAAAAGVPIVAAVSAPSSLACDLARSFGMTLVGFARGNRFSIYSGAHRIHLPGK
jgi:FdhD protein